VLTTITFPAFLEIANERPRWLLAIGFIDSTVSDHREEADLNDLCHTATYGSPIDAQQISDRLIGGIASTSNTVVVIQKGGSNSLFRSVQSIS
jgi:hypothetical protein